MINFASFLTRKYDLLQQAQDTARLGMQASANLDTVKAGLLPAESRANINLTGAQAGLANATTRQQDEETKTIAPLARASIGLSGSQSRLYGAQATGEEQLNKPAPFRFRGLGTNLGVVDDLVRKSLRFGMGPFASE
jgi:hypothetical protein